MNITRKRFIVMRKNRSEVWCGLSKNFHFKPISEVKDTSIKTYRSQAQAKAGCSSWDRNFEVVPITETIVIDPKTNADRIRAKNDEDLAEEFVSFFEAGMEVMSDEKITTEVRNKLSEMVLEQLQQPAKEER